MDEITKTLMDETIELLMDEFRHAVTSGDFTATLEKAEEMFRKAFQAGADSVKSEADLINDTVEQICGKREDEASRAMAQVILMKMYRILGERNPSISITIDSDKVVDDIANSRLTVTAPSSHEMTYTLDVLS